MPSECTPWPVATLLVNLYGLGPFLQKCLTYDAEETDHRTPGQRCLEPQ